MVMHIQQIILPPLLFSGLHLGRMLLLLYIGLAFLSSHGGVKGYENKINTDKLLDNLRFSKTSKHVSPSEAMDRPRYILPKSITYHNMESDVFRQSADNVPFVTSFRYEENVHTGASSVHSEINPTVSSSIPEFSRDILTNSELYTSLVFPNPTGIMVSSQLQWSLSKEQQYTTIAYPSVTNTVNTEESNADDVKDRKLAAKTSQLSHITGTEWLSSIPYLNNLVTASQHGYISTMDDRIHPTASYQNSHTLIPSTLSYEGNIPSLEISSASESGQSDLVAHSSTHVYSTGSVMDSTLSPSLGTVHFSLADTSQLSQHAILTTPLSQNWVGYTYDINEIERSLSLSAEPISVTPSIQQTYDHNTQIQGNPTITPSLPSDPIYHTGTPMLLPINITMASQPSMETSEISAINLPHIITLTPSSSSSSRGIPSTPYDSIFTVRSSTESIEATTVNLPPIITRVPSPSSIDRPLPVTTLPIQSFTSIEPASSVTESKPTSPRVLVATVTPKPRDGKVGVQDHPKDDKGGGAYRTKVRKLVTAPMISKATEISRFPARSPKKFQDFLTKPVKSWTVNGLTTSPFVFGVSKNPPPLGRIMTSTVSPHLEAPEVYLTFEIRMSWSDFCSRIEEFRKVIISIIDQTYGHGEHYGVEVMRSDECTNAYNVMKRSAEIAVDVYIINNKGKYDMRMTSKLASSITLHLLDDQPGPFKGKVTRVHVVGAESDKDFPVYQKEKKKSLNKGTVAGIVIACIISLCLLGFIFFQMVIIARRRTIKKTRAIMYDGTRPSVELHSIEESIQMISMSTPQFGRYTYTNPALETSDHKDYTSNPLTLKEAKEFLQDPDGEEVEDEFLMLPNIMPRMSEVPDGGELKNRYANVIPHKQTRVLLTGNGGDEYINANYVRGYDRKGRMYIATQAPMENTTVDFWNMVWFQQSQVILMLTGLEENGQSKCVEYWPNTDGSDIVRIYGDFNVQLQRRDITEHWISSTLLLKNMEGNLYREIQHVWFTAWPYSGVPADPNSVLDLLLTLRPMMEDSHGPTIVHCSPGTGRTGTLLAIDVGMRSFDSTQKIDVLQTVRQLREDRAGAVQTRDQYNFIYKALLHYAIHSTMSQDEDDAEEKDLDSSVSDNSV